MDLWIKKRTSKILVLAARDHKHFNKDIYWETKLSVSEIRTKGMGLEMNWCAIPQIRGVSELLLSSGAPVAQLCTLCFYSTVNNSPWGRGGGNNGQIVTCQFLG